MCVVAALSASTSRFAFASAHFVSALVFVFTHFASSFFSSLVRPCISLYLARCAVMDLSPCCVFLCVCRCRLCSSPVCVRVSVSVCLFHFVCLYGWMCASFVTYEGGDWGTAISYSQSPNPASVLASHNKQCLIFFLYPLLTCHTPSFSRSPSFPGTLPPPPFLRRFV